MTAQRRPLVVGNWKMNGLRQDGVALAQALAEKAQQQPVAAEVAVCPPATLIADIGGALDKSVVEFGGQDCSPHDSGAHTGDIAAPMLADLGCRFVIVGHSERRSDHSETDSDVRAKATAAINAGLCAIVCVGESGAERDAGQTLDVVGDQISGSLPDGLRSTDVVVAYEPVWAIGTGRTPSAEDIAEVHAHIRTKLADISPDLAEAVRILYGGSVNAENAATILAIANVDGALVGGASLRADSFWTICSAAKADSDG